MITFADFYKKDNTQSTMEKNKGFQNKLEKEQK
jgi:hypothetical protein